MKILFYEVRHFSPNFHEFIGSKTKFAFFSPKLEKKKKLSKSVWGYYEAKKKEEKSGIDH